MASTNSGGRSNNAKMPISRAEAKGRSCCLRSMTAVEVSPGVGSGTVSRVLLLRTEPIALFNDFKFIVGVGWKMSRFYQLGKRVRRQRWGYLNSEAQSRAVKELWRRQKKWGRRCGSTTKSCWSLVGFQRPLSPVRCGHPTWMLPLRLVGNYFWVRNRFSFHSWRTPASREYGHYANETPCYKCRLIVI